jgi:tetratricopeptide (TPR) repeat protein
MRQAEGRDLKALDDALRTVKVHKEEAKLYRDDGDLEGAVAVLREAVELLSGFAPADEEAEPDEARKQVAWNLADTLGMLGGNYRRMGLLGEALRSFEEGKRYEVDSRFGIDSTYNVVNAITLPIEMGVRTASEQRPSLEAALAALERATSGSRRLDRWAWADLGQTALLMGDTERAHEAYRRFRDLGDEAAIRSHLTVLQRFRDALAERDPEVCRALDDGIAFLETDGSSS